MKNTAHLHRLFLFLIFTLFAINCASRPAFVDYHRHNKRPREATSTKNRQPDAQPTASARKSKSSRSTKSSPSINGQHANRSTNSLEWALASELLPLLDSPYKYGGESASGIDCSGLTRTVYSRAFNIDLPHKASYQFNLGTAISKKRLLAGDLVFFYDKKDRKIGHVGIYLAENQFIHSAIRRGVIISSLDGAYWRKHYAGARRYISK